MNATLAGVEELDLFPDEQAREAAIKSHADSIKGWSLVLGIGVCAVVSLSAMFFARVVLVPGISMLMPHGLPPWSREPLQWAFVLVAMYLTLRGLHRWGVRRALRKKLIAHQVPVCLGCGYLLHGLPPDTGCCPECGRAIDEDIAAILQSNSSADATTS